MSQLEEQNLELNAAEALGQLHEWTGAAYRALWEWAKAHTKTEDEAWECFGECLQAQIMKGKATVLDGQLVLFGGEGVPA